MIIDKSLAHGKEISWLLSARLADNEESRFACNFLYVFNHENAVDFEGVPCLRGACTDGHRLHVLNDVNAYFMHVLEPGFYRIESNTKKSLVMDKVGNDGDKYKKQTLCFPNWQLVIPTYEPEAEFTWRPSTHNANETANSIVAFHFNFPERSSYDFTFMKDIANGADDWHVSWYAPDIQAVFTALNQLAVVMPRTV